MNILTSSRKLVSVVTGSAALLTLLAACSAAPIEEAADVEQAAEAKALPACENKLPLSSINVPPGHVNPACDPKVGMPGGRPCADVRAAQMMAGMPGNFDALCKTPFIINFPGTGCTDAKKGAGADLWDGTARYLAMSAYVQTVACKNTDPGCGPGGKYAPKTFGELMTILAKLGCGAGVQILHNGGPVFPDKKNERWPHKVPRDSVGPKCNAKECDPKDPEAMCVDASLPNADACFGKKAGTPASKVDLSKVDLKNAKLASADTDAPTTTVATAVVVATPIVNEPVYEATPLDTPDVIDVSAKAAE